MQFVFYIRVMPSTKLLLPIIVFSQFAGTSLWFAGNAIINDIHPDASAGNITSVVQFGFIAGTLIFSLFTIADRYPAPRVFFVSSFIAALANLLLVWLAKDDGWLFTLRFITGFFLAGIYPVGMKIAADHFPGKLGNALGFLVGALVLGTAFPHLLRSSLHQLRWQDVFKFTSLLAFTGGLLVLIFVPYVRKDTITRIKLNTAFTVFRSSNFRAAAFGYFGHMWELYTFWAFVPFIISTYNQQHYAVGRQDRFDVGFNVSYLSFLVIAIGCFGCIIGGLISQKNGSKKVAFYSLLISGICCLISPWLFNFSHDLFAWVLMIWGFTVVSDSPQFSTLVAQSAPAENKGTALTIVTSIGFAITILSIQLVKLITDASKEYSLLILVVGPLFGLFFLKNYKTRKGNL
jgi:MFS family permease